MVGASLDAYHCSYPPVLLLTTPLARMAHVPALLAWLAAGWYAFLHCVWRCRAQGALLLALAAPAVFINAVGGQNSTGTALFGGGLSLLRATAAARRRIAQTADLQAAAKAADPGCVTCGAALRASEGVAVSLGERDVA